MAKRKPKPLPDGRRRRPVRFTDRQLEAVNASIALALADIEPFHRLEVRRMREAHQKVQEEMARRSLFNPETGYVKHEYPSAN